MNKPMSGFPHYVGKNLNKGCVESGVALHYGSLDGLQERRMNFYACQLWVRKSGFDISGTISLQI
jgi:hypothetical protein